MMALWRLLLGLVRPALPFLLGVSLGCSLGLLRVSWIPELDEEPCVRGAPGPYRLHAATHNTDMEELRPRILPYHRRARPRYRKVLRTRFIQSELGFRERLLVGVLSSRSTLPSLAVAVNRTLSSSSSPIGRLLFFSGSRAAKPLPGMEVVSPGDERSAWLMYHTLHHLQTHFLSSYDWFFISQDDAYTNGYRLRELLAHLGPAPPAYIGLPMEFIGGQEGWRYCSGGAGFLLSRLLLLRLSSHLERCRADILSTRGDEWLGRCLQDTLGIACANHHQGMRYRSYTLSKNEDVGGIEEAELSRALSVHPVRDPASMYRLQRRLSQARLRRTYSQIQQLQGEVRNLSALSQDGGRSLEWPLGVNPSFRPKSRFDLLTWDGFTETHTFSCPDGSPRCPLQGAWRVDAREVLEEAMEQLNRRHQPWITFRRLRLLNGYRRFDPTRGMEYTLDILLEATTREGHARVLTKRLVLLRPLSLVEILPMPYVTEAAHVQLLCPLMAADVGSAAGFLDSFATNLLDTQENVALTLLLVYDGAAAGEEQDVFREVRVMVTQLQKRYTFLHLESIDVHLHNPSQLRLVGVASKKHPLDALFFLLSVWSQVTPEALNRCRMNAIRGWQVFSPLPYQEYSPEVSPGGPSAHEFRGPGHFDRLASSEFCFYNSDFMAVHKKMPTLEEEGGQEEEGAELLDLFLRHSDLHLFRAAEPELSRRFSSQKCGSHLSDDGYHRCVLSSLESLGSRLDLAMALFTQDQNTRT